MLQHSQVVSHNTLEAIHFPTSVMHLNLINDGTTSGQSCQIPKHWLWNHIKHIPCPPTDSNKLFNCSELKSNLGTRSTLQKEWQIPWIKSFCTIPCFVSNTPGGSERTWITGRSPCTCLWMLHTMQNVIKLWMQLWTEEGQHARIFAAEIMHMLDAGWRLSHQVEVACLHRRNPVVLARTIVHSARYDIHSWVSQRICRRGLIPNDGPKTDP